ncbi:MAG: HIT family protein [Hydrogenophilales bacterium]|nr:HIT family protein [Hydrogenophilales bacterium]
MSADCPFCRPTGMLLENDLAYAIRDTSPATPGHLLVLPRRHVADWFDTSAPERQAIFELADAARARLDAEFHPDGYNLGINVGETAGQTIFHVHLHLIPRYRGDVANPRGGVRGVIPGKQGY